MDRGTNLRDVNVRDRPIKKRLEIVHNRIGEQMKINAPFLDQQESNLQGPAYRIAPSVVAYAAQCSVCLKWRFLPSKQMFEAIREDIRKRPFVCSAQGISCNDDPELEQDGGSLWAIERPNIARPPRGWERLLRIRACRESRFADVYYVTPSGKRLRSKADVQSYLLEHPNEGEGVDISRFSFQIPKPVHDDPEKEHTDCVLALSHSSEVQQDRRKRRRMLS